MAWSFCNNKKIIYVCVYILCVGVNCIFSRENGESKMPDCGALLPSELSVIYIIYVTHFINWLV